jgi:hypothetical protein
MRKKWLDITNRLYLEVAVHNTLYVDMGREGIATS